MPRPRILTATLVVALVLAGCGAAAERPSGSSPDLVKGPSRRW